MPAERTDKNLIQHQPQSPWKASLFLLFVIGSGVIAGLAAANQTVGTVIAMAAVVLGIALLVSPDSATLLVVFLIYTNMAVLGVKYHGLPSIVTILVPVMLLLPLFYHLVLRRESLVIPSSLPWLALFMVVLMISTILSVDVSTAFAELITYLTEGFFLYLLITNVVRDSQQMRRVIWALLAAGILLGLVPLYQQVTGTFDNNYGGLAQMSAASFRTGEESLQGDVRQPRLAGAIGEINRFAQVMLMLVPLGLFRFWGEKSRLLRIAGLLAALLAGLGMVLAFSRGAAIAFALMVVLMTFFRMIKPVQLIAFALSGVLLLAAMPQYSARLLSIQSVASLFGAESTGGESSPDGAIKGRATEMLAALKVYADHPVFGVGPGMFKYYSREYSLDLGLRYLTGFREAHSLYFGLAAETGSLGLVTFLAMVVVTFRDLLRARKRSQGIRPDLENLATSFILVLLAYLTTGLFLHLSYMRYFWLMFALASAAGAIVQKELDQTQPELALVVNGRDL